MSRSKRWIVLAGGLAAVAGVCLLTLSLGAGSAAASADSVQSPSGLVAIDPWAAQLSERVRVLRHGVRQAAALHRDVTRRDICDRRTSAVVRRRVVRATRPITGLTLDVIAYNRRVRASSPAGAADVSDLQRLNTRVLSLDAEALRLRVRVFRKRSPVSSPRLLAASGRLTKLQARARRRSTTPTLPASATPTALPTSSATPTPVTPGRLNLNPPDGYVFNGGGVTSTAGTLTLGNNCTITGVNFTGGGSGLQIRGNGNTVRDCTFGPYSWAALILWVGDDNVIDDCTFNGISGSGANIQIMGGKRNRITNNVTRGGVTAIAFLYFRNHNGGGQGSLIEDNTVSGNTCSGFSEEGITFDVIGNIPASVASVEYDRIQSISGSSVTLSPLPFPSYAGYDMVFLSGALEGCTRSIVAQSGATFSLDGPLDGVRPGDEVVIGATFKRNVVTGNTVTASSAGWPGIKLYGMAFGNRIEGNSVPTGIIEVESVDNLVIASGSATQAYARAPSGYNTVAHNTLPGAITVNYYAWPTSPSGHVNTYDAYRSKGNNIIGNQCGRLNANNQWCYIAGNTGTANLSHVILNEVEMVP